MTTKQDKRLLPEVEEMISATAARQIEHAEEVRRPRAFRRSRQTLGVVLASLALAGTALAAVTGWNPLAAGPTHLCNSFIGESSDGTTLYRIVVSNSSGLSCKRATSVIEAFWSPEKAVTQHGQVVSNSYYTIRGFPGWRCQEAAGTGLCRLRDGRVAEYEVWHTWDRRVPRAANHPRGTTAVDSSSNPRPVSPRGVGVLQLGTPAKELQQRHLIGGLSPGCELYEGERGARLRPPLTGFAYFIDPGTRLSALVIRRGAETARHIGIGSTVDEARNAYPRAPYDPPGTFEPFAEGFLWVGGRAHPKMSFTIDPKSRVISEIYVGSVHFCE
jgi:hypothetical protein